MNECNGETKVDETEKGGERAGKKEKEVVNVQESEGGEDLSQLDWIE